MPLRDVALRLGNTIAVCRSSYVHPAIIEGYLAGSPCAMPEDRDGGAEGLSAEEEAVLRYLEASCERNGPSGTLNPENLEPLRRFHLRA